MTDTFDLLKYLGINHNLDDAVEPKEYEYVAEVVHGACANDGDRFVEGNWGRSDWKWTCARCFGDASPRMVGILATEVID